MKYPTVVDEVQTLNLLQAGASIARFGDGELRLATGGDAVSQRGNYQLAQQLRNILARPSGPDLALVGIPNVYAGGPNGATWLRYAQPEYTQLYKQKSYVSAFITRPDSAPWIDTPEYWAAVRDLWRGRSVILVVGDDKSLTAEMCAGAASVDVIMGPNRDAYSSIKVLDRRVRERVAQLSAAAAPLVLLCLGATATVMAESLAARRIQAIDMGHMGMFLRAPGLFSIPQSDLISPAYLEQNKVLHADPRGFGGSGKKHAELVLELAKKLQVRGILDYGCGEGTLKKALKSMGWPRSIQEYDPAMKGLARLPKPADLIVCTDVLEHIEPDKLAAVLAHLHKLMNRVGFFTIATRPANKVLPDGRNAHLIQQSPDWWKATLTAAGFVITQEVLRMKDGNPREVWLWLSKS